MNCTRNGFVDSHMLHLLLPFVYGLRISKYLFRYMQPKCLQSSIFSILAMDCAARTKPELFFSFTYFLLLLLLFVLLRPPSLFNLLFSYLCDFCVMLLLVSVDFLILFKELKWSREEDKEYMSHRSCFRSFFLSFFLFCCCLLYLHRTHQCQ